MKSVMPVGIAAFVVLLSAAPCQFPRELRIAVQNLNFADSSPGAPPQGWFLGPEWYSPSLVPVYEAQTVAGKSCTGNHQCATVHSIREVLPGRLSFFYQVLDAAQYRGKSLKFRAAVRTEVESGGMARLLVRVHRMDCSTSFRYDLGNHPITSDKWSTYEIEAPIDWSARDLEFGLQLFGKGAAWIDDVSM